MLRSLGPKVRKIVLGDRKVVRAGRTLGEDAHLVDEVRDELAAPNFQYLDGLPRGLQGGVAPDLVASRTVAVNQGTASHFATNV